MTGATASRRKKNFARAAVGVLVIFRLADLHRYGSEEVWQPIPAGERAAVEIDGLNCGPFHAEPENRDGGAVTRQRAPKGVRG